MRILTLLIAGAVQALALAIAAGSPAGADIRSFEGVWIKTDATTPTLLTRIEIAREDGRVVIRAFDGCLPVDCDWGRATATPYGVHGEADPLASTQALLATFPVDAGIRRTLAIHRDGDRLRVTVYTRFTDGNREGAHVTTDIIRRAN